MAACIVPVAKADPHSELGLTFVKVRGRRKNGLSLSCDLPRSGELVNERRQHIIISSVLANSPSVRAGLCVGEEILSINGEEVDSVVGAVTALRLADAGSVQLDRSRPWLRS